MGGPDKRDAPGPSAADASHADHDHDHDHPHDHSHKHAHAKADEHSHDLQAVAEWKLRTAFIVTLGFMAVEIVFGLYANSLTLTSDAGHLFADAGALLLALIAQRFARRVATQHRTYGFRRAETLAAFLNGVALAATAVIIVREAIERWHTPEVVRGSLVVLVGSVGLVVNVALAWLLASGHEHNLNTRAALAHVAFDAVGSFLAIASGLLAWKLGWMRVDPVLSIAMAGLISVGGWVIVRRTTAVLMEGTPVGLDLAELDRTIRATPGVAELHDLHAWTISDGFDSVTVHVVLEPGYHGTDVARRVGERVHATHHVAHVTVQPEAPRTVELRPARSLLQRSN